MIVVVPVDQAGLVKLTEDELRRLMKNAYDEGFNEATYNQLLQKIDAHNEEFFDFPYDSRTNICI